MLYYWHAGTLGPYGELLGSGCAEGIRRRKDYVPALIFIIRSYLAQRGSLPHAVHADHHYHGPVRPVEKWLFGPHEIRQQAYKLLARLGTLLDLLFGHRIPKAAEQLIGDCHAYVCHYESFFQLLVEFVVYAGACEYSRYAAACLGKPLPELIKKARHLYFLLFGYYADSVNFADTTLDTPRSSIATP